MREILGPVIFKITQLVSLFVSPALLVLESPISMFYLFCCGPISLPHLALLFSNISFSFPSSPNSHTPEPNACGDISISPHLSLLSSCPASFPFSLLCFLFLCTEGKPAASFSLPKGLFKLETLQSPYPLSSPSCKHSLSHLLSVAPVFPQKSPEPSSFRGTMFVENWEMRGRRGQEEIREGAALRAFRFVRWDLLAIWFLVPLTFSSDLSCYECLHISLQWRFPFCLTVVSH